jgi:hypothetical protein
MSTIVVNARSCRPVVTDRQLRPHHERSGQIVVLRRRRDTTHSPAPRPSAPKPKIACGHSLPPVNGSPPVGVGVAAAVTGALVVAGATTVVVVWPATVVPSTETEVVVVGATVVVVPSTAIVVVVVGATSVVVVVGATSVVVVVGATVVVVVASVVVVVCGSVVVVVEGSVVVVVGATVVVVVASQFVRSVTEVLFVFVTLFEGHVAVTVRTTVPVWLPEKVLLACVVPLGGTTAAQPETPTGVAPIAAVTVRMSIVNFEPDSLLPMDQLTTCWFSLQVVWPERTG